MRLVKVGTGAVILAVTVSWSASGSIKGDLPGTGGAENPDWPCIQRFVPEVSEGMVWAGPPLSSVENDSAAAPPVAELANELAARRVPLEEARAMVDEFADDLTPEGRQDRLTRLFAETLEIINDDRSSIISGIRRYARGQRQLAERIAEKNEQIEDLPASQTSERQQLMVERDWDIRVFDDRRDSLTYLCEQPVLLEQRAFTLGRAIASHLEQN